MIEEDRLVKMQDLGELSIQVWEGLRDSGKYLPFYGVDCYRFKLGETIFEAIEDPGDGHRSCLGLLIVNEETDKDKCIFFNTPVAHVQIRNDSVEEDNFRGWTLVDANGHIWLTVGTSEANGYYPWFRFGYSPKDPATQTNTDVSPILSKVLESINLSHSDKVTIDKEHLVALKAITHKSLDLLEELSRWSHPIKIITEHHNTDFYDLNLLSDLISRSIDVLRQTGRIK